MTPILSTMNVPSSAWRSGRRVLRGIGRTLAALFGLIVVLGLVGAVYESAAEAADVRAYPPPGQLVDVGGYRSNLATTSLTYTWTSSVKDPVSLEGPVPKLAISVVTSAKQHSAKIMLLWNAQN